MTSSPRFAFPILAAVVSVLLPTTTWAFFLGQLLPEDSAEGNGLYCNIFLCRIASPCQNGGTCHLNVVDCTVKCLCPAPFNDTQLYDQRCQQRRLPAHAQTQTPTAQTGTQAQAQAQTVSCSPFRCWFSNPCHNGGDCSLDPTDCSTKCACLAPYDDPTQYDENCRARKRKVVPPKEKCPLSQQCVAASPCQNGGVCLTSAGADCVLTCRCPPPYDNAALYDHHCRAKNVSACVGAACDMEFQTVQKKVCPNDGIFGCDHGDCLVMDGTEHMSIFCRCFPGWVGSRCQYPCTRNCSNGGRCIYLEGGSQKCNCPFPWTGENCTVWPPEPMTGFWSGKRADLRPHRRFYRREFAPLYKGTLKN